MEQCFVAPPQLQLKEDMQAMLTKAGTKYELTQDFLGQIASADAIYMTRIQDEWDAEGGESARIDTSSFCFTTESLDLLKDDAIIMHPLPRRAEIPVEVDHDPRAMYWRQMRNGMWVRAALIASIFRCDDEIQAYFEKNV